jgi:hypothetical protein
VSEVSVALAESAVLEVSVASVALVESAVLEVLAEPVVSGELVASEVPAVLESPVVRAELAGATGRRSGSTTRSIAAERPMEIDPQPTGSAV